MDEIENEIMSALKKHELTVKEVIEVLDNCKQNVLNNMPINENLKSKFNW